MITINDEIYVHDDNYRDDEKTSRSDKVFDVEAIGDSKHMVEFGFTSRGRATMSEE